MTRLIAIILTLSFSMLLGVDTPKELEANPQTPNSPEIILDVNQVQQVRQMKKGMNATFKQARKASSKIPKPESFQTKMSAKTQKPDFEKYTQAHKTLSLIHI